MKISSVLLWKITLACGMLAALIGLLLRYFFVSPLAFNFKFVLHAHSHLMLLGWLFNALILLLYRQWGVTMPRSHRRLIAGMAFCLLGMLISFPLQGYAAASISFSTLHLWLSYWLLIKIWKHLRARGLPRRLLRIGILFFFLASLGPYALGPLMANNMQSSAWYQQAIFFYLHFLYNGAFLFFALAIICKKWLRPKPWRENRFLWLFSLGAILSWFHNLDYSFDAFWINALGGLGAILQIWAGIMLYARLDQSALRSSQWLLLGALGLKLFFELLGSIPLLADAVVANRFYLIAWLHYIFLGFFSPFIWWQLQPRQGNSYWLGLYWLIFLLSEALLIAPSLFYIEGFHYWPQLTFASYALLIICWAALLRQSWRGLRQQP